MSNEQRIEIQRDELFTASIDDELARRQARRGGRPPEPPPLSPVRRLIQSSLFYLPAAAALAALLSWMLFEPYVHDLSHVAGEVVLVDDDPFLVENMRSITVGGTEVLLNPDTRFEPGEDGQPAFASGLDIAPGQVVEVVGFLTELKNVIAIAVRPTTREHASEIPPVLDEELTFATAVMFPVTATLIAIFLLLAEGISTRNWNRMLVRTFIGMLLTSVFSFLAMIPAGLFMTIAELFINADAADVYYVTIESISSTNFFFFTVFRSLAWASIGAGLGLGMTLSRSTRAQLRNAMIGGTMGGALGGLFFDPIDRFIPSAAFDMSAGTSRLVGFLAVGLCIGFFVALVERLSRVAWIRVRTGPLAGKAFVLYRTPTAIGSASSADIYLFKDAEIDPEHALIHRIGNHFEIEDNGSRCGVTVNDRDVRRRRLMSGDQILLGSTVLEFEERAKSTPTA
ncbi:FHA domain-containing protein [Haliangium sp.]|uniref:FHA domain-containing protein n=1 Tax=Haliangium sp. TaxID=2663208 RepID=UPI003D12758A